MTDEQKKFYKSNEWERCRQAYISSVGGLCERCRANGVINPGYIVHHKEYITPENFTDPAVSLSFDNLEYVCLQCHNQIHFKRKRRYEVRADGSVAPLCP